MLHTSGVALLLFVQKLNCAVAALSISPWTQRPGSSFRTQHVAASSLDDSLAESPADEKMRLFWEQSDPFKVAKRVVHRVLTKSPSLGRLLIPLEDGVNENDANDPFNMFYSGDFPIAALSFKHCRTANDKKQSFRLDLAYAGEHFCGWQRQPNNIDLPSVQEALENALEAASFWNPQGPSPDVRVSGRTDAGVSAVGQVARVRIPPPREKQSRTDVSSDEIMTVLETAAKIANYTWRCLSVTAASDTFHPTFDSRTRSYVYLLDIDAISAFFQLNLSDASRLNRLTTRMNALFAPLVGKELDYFAFSYGKVKTETTLCRLETLRAVVLREAVAPKETVLAIELTGDRFLRRMVRILVDTSLQIALAEEMGTEKDCASETGSSRAVRCDHQLVDICASKDRRRSARAAPSEGLIFMHADMSPCP